MSECLEGEGEHTQNEGVEVCVCVCGGRERTHNLEGERVHTK